MNTYTIIITSILGFIGQILVLKYFIIKQVRINEQQFKIIYDKCIDKKKFVINEELTVDKKRPPSILSMISHIEGIGLFYLSKNEREHKAGWTAFSTTCELWVFRWNYKKVKAFISQSYVSTKEINVFINDHYLGGILINKDAQIRKIYSEIENDFKRIENGELATTSGLLYGLPGNGKTSFIRNIASKYGWNVKYFDLDANTQNFDILAATTYVPDKTIILFEDFDSVFENRKLIKFEKNTEIKFSFDAILNLLDGLYKGDKKIVFLMTCNDIDKIDSSIKDRRSRMKHKIYVDKPDYKEIDEIIGNKKI